jgi:hypothetical protein
MLVEYSSIICDPAGIVVPGWVSLTRIASFVRFPGPSFTCDPTCSLHVSHVRAAFGGGRRASFRLEDGKRKVVEVAARVARVDRSFRRTQTLYPLYFVHSSPVSESQRGGVNILHVVVRGVRRERIYDATAKS